MCECPFCLENGKVKILVENEVACLTQALKDGRPMPGRFLIIPKEHIESVLDLPSDWQMTVRELLRTHFGPELATMAFNLSYNQGRAAGQRVRHVHAWVVLRSGEEGRPSRDLGLATLIERVNGQA